VVKVTSINNLANEIARELQRYAGLVEEEFEVSKKDVVDQLLDELNEHRATYKIRSGNYNKGWRVKKKGNAYIVHNKTNYQQTHLLEKGHAKADGSGRVQSFQHIGPAEKKAVEELLRRVDQAVRQ
jgi:hypothetical protein